MPAEGLLIARFGPFTADGCRRNAQGTFDDDREEGRTGRYGVSAYGIVPSPGEELDDSLRRLCAEVPVTGKSIAVVPATILESEGWHIEMDIPPAHHYLMGKDDFSEMPDVDALAVIWSTYRRRNPAWTRR